MWWLGPWAPKFNLDWANLLVALVGWIALVESFWGWCWLHRLFGIDEIRLWFAKLNLVSKGQR